MGKDIGERIKKLRLERKMSVEELAKKIGKNKATVYRYEKNDIESMPYTVLVPIAEALNTTPAYLLGWESNGKINANLGHVLKELRLKKNKKLSEISQELHISEDIYNEYELGKRIIPYEVLEHVASHLGVDPDAILAYTNNDDDTTVYISSRKENAMRFDEWKKEFVDVDWTDEEFYQIMDFARYVLNKRKGKDELN